MLPIVKPYQAKTTYAGEPIDAYSKLIDSIGSTFDKTKQAKNTLDIAFDQFKFLDGDTVIAKPILNKYREVINNLAKDAAGNTRYDKAYNQVENLMVDFAKNTHLQHLGKNWAAAEEDRKKLADGDFNTKYIGVDNTKNFRSFNPDGTLNNYKSGIETRLDHEKAAARIIEQVAPEVVNSVEGLSEQEKQMIGSQGLYKFVTTEKKDSDTYKKVWNHIRNVAKSTPELDQYLRFKGEGALDNLLMNEGLLRQYKAEKVNIEQSPTVGLDKESIKQQANEDAYLSAFTIEPDGVKKAAAGEIVKLPEDEEVYNSKSIDYSKKDLGTGSKLAQGTSPLMFNKKYYDESAAKEVARAKALSPELRKLSNGKVAKYLNENKEAFNQEINTKFGHSDIIIRPDLAVMEGSRIDIDGINIKSQDTNVVLADGDRKDKATLKEKFDKTNVNFNFDKPIKSLFLGVVLPMDGDKHSVGGYKYLLQDADGNKQEVIKYNDNFNKSLKPVNEIFTKLHTLVKQSSEEHLRTKATKTDYTILNTSGGTFKVRPIVGNLKTYKYGKDTTIPNVGEGIDTRIELVDSDGDVAYLTAEQFQNYVGKSLVKEESFRNNFKKPNID